MENKKTSEWVSFWEWGNLGLKTWQIKIRVSLLKPIAYKKGRTQLSWSFPDSVG